MYEALLPFIDRSDLGDYLRRDLTTDDLALMAVDSACSLVRSAAGQRFDSLEDETVLVDGSGTDTLVLPEMPVTSVSSVELNEVEVDETKYLVSGNSGRLVMKHGVWTKGRGNYSVTYSHGYSDVPTDIRILAIQLAARIYDQGIVKQEQVGGNQVVFASDDPIGLTPRELSVVAKYRSVRSSDTFDAPSGS